jgi:hypothetical protein
MTQPYSQIPTGTLSGEPIMSGYQEAIDRQKYRGIASLTHDNKTLTFRTNPNSVTWSYKLNTVVENTAGGRVIQILSTSMEDLRVVIECGMGGWDYAMKVARFMRDMMINQKGKGGTPGTFRYTTRGWDLNVYALNIPFQDRVTETTREIELNFKIQEDVSGVLTKQTISTELSRLRDGIGFTRSAFNTGSGVRGDGTEAPVILSAPDLGGTLTMAEIPSTQPYGDPVLGTINSFQSQIRNAVGSVGGVLGR